MKVDLRLYTLLLAVGLGLAWWASLPVEDEAKEKYTVFKIDDKSIGDITYTADNIVAKVYKPAGKSRFWVTWEKKPKDKDKGNEPLHFVASDKINRFIESLDPLQAERLIGKVEEAKLEGFGLKEPEATLKITSADGKNNIDINFGKKSYGSSNRFALENRSQQVILVKSVDFDALETAQKKFFERKIFDQDYDDVSKAHLKAQEKSRTLNHDTRNDRGQLVWTAEGEEEAKKSYQSFMDKFKKLRITEFLEVSREQQLKDKPALLSVEFEDSGKVIEKIKFIKLDAGQGLSAQSQGEAEYWVYSDFLNAWARISTSRMAALEKDIPNIIGG